MSRPGLVLDDKYYVKVLCPTCYGAVWVAKAELNCRVFRHAVLLATGEPLNPHASKIECDELVRTNSVLGCAQPFRIELYQEEFVPGTLPVPDVPAVPTTMSTDATVSDDMACTPMVTRYRAVICGFDE